MGYRFTTTGRYRTATWTWWMQRTTAWRLKTLICLLLYFSCWCCSLCCSCCCCHCHLLLLSLSSIYYVVGCAIIISYIFLFIERSLLMLLVVSSSSDIFFFLLKGVYSTVGGWICADLAGWLKKYNYLVKRKYVFIFSVAQQR